MIDLSIRQLLQSSYSQAHRHIQVLGQFQLQHDGHGDIRFQLVLICLIQVLLLKAHA